jgi:hypothetical protein
VEIGSKIELKKALLQSDENNSVRSNAAEKEYCELYVKESLGRGKFAAVFSVDAIHYAAASSSSSAEICTSVAVREENVALKVAQFIICDNISKLVVPPEAVSIEFMVKDDCFF